MQFVAVLVAAAGAYAFGAVWYMTLAKPWAAAAGVKCDDNGKPLNARTMPFIVSGISVILVAGMMRHVFNMAQIDIVGKGFLAGLGIGVFLVLPWIVTNYAYAGRPRNLTLIDGAYSAIGCTIIGTILTMF